MVHPLQKQIIEFILSTYKGNKAEGIRDLQKVLSISQAAVYKRLNGSILLTIVDLEKLIAHYAIPPSLFLPKGQGILCFDFAPIANESKVKQPFIPKVLEALREIAASKEGSVTYTSIDVPFFYYFMHKELAYFKLFHFQHGTSQTPLNKLPKIDLLNISKKQEKEFQNIVTIYSRIGSEEIWTSQALKITADEIYYFYKAGLFLHHNDALLLLDKLLVLAGQLSDIISKHDKGLMTDTAHKGGKLQLYCNDFSRFHSVILTRSGAADELYLTYNVPDYLYCRDPDFIAYTSTWIDNLKRKALQLTDNGDMELASFFRPIKKHIQSVRKNIVEMSA